MALTNGKTKSIISQTLLHVLMAVLLFIMLFPLAMSLWSAFKTDITYPISKFYPTLPLRLSNIPNAFGAVYRFIINTVIVGAAGVAGMIILTVFAAYAFGRLDFPGKKFFYSLVLGLMMIPGILSLVPQFMLYKSFGLLDTLVVLILPVITGGAVFGVFLTTNFFRGLPKDMFEAARIDGANELRCVFMIAVPLSMPILGTLVIITLINVWNDYLWPMITITDIKLLTISAGLKITYTSSTEKEMPVTFAGYLLASLPLIILFIFSNKYYIQGLISSSIKM